jgi:hypothetical protein
LPDILDLLEPGTLDRTPPRRLPAFFLPNLIGEYLLDRPLRSYFSLFVAICLTGALALAAMGAPAWASLGLILLAVIRMFGPALRIFRDVREDYLLMRHGLILTAHIIGLRPCHEPGPHQGGAFLDCAVPITRQRTSVGSIWIADAGEAVRLSTLGKLTVVCLPRAPGAWRLYKQPTPAAQRVTPSA